MKTLYCPLCKRLPVPFPFKGFPLYCCTNCQLIFRHPIPSASELTNIYKNNDYFSFWGNKKNLDAIHKMKAKTAELFLSKITPLFKNKKPLYLLEVGCATGALLETAQKQGFEVTGIEPNPKFSQLAQKITGQQIYAEPFEKINFPPYSFDIIVFFDVLEHFANFNMVIKKCFSLLKSGGLIAISTPDTKSLSFKILGTRWPHFKSEHLHYFNAKNLALLLESNGFRVELKNSSLKALTLDYIRNYFITYKIPVLSFLSKLLFTFIPKFFLSLSITIRTGNILIVARKSA